MAIQVGDKLPTYTFAHIPYTDELEDHLACGVPTKLSTDEWKGKKVVLFAIPGAFTPTCHQEHLPGFVKKYDQLKAKGVDVVAVVAANDPFVLSGWARVEGLKDKILALTDTNVEFSKQIGHTLDLSGLGLGTRTGRYALIIDDLIVKYAEVEPSTGVTVSGVDAVLEALSKN